MISGSVQVKEARAARQLGALHRVEGTKGSYQRLKGILRYTLLQGTV